MQAGASEHLGTLAQFLPTYLSQTSLSESSCSDVRSGYQVLIIEGSVSFARLLATGLSAGSLEVNVAHDLDAAMLHLDKRVFDLLILDLDLPGQDGLSLLATLRLRRPKMRVLVLSGTTGVEGLVAALDHGADDYLIKPFSLLEMMARLRALRRRSNESTSTGIPQTGHLLLRRDTFQVERDGRAIDLTPREFALLEFMMQHAGKTLSRATLTQHVWNMPAETNTNIVDVYVKYLRDKLDEGYDDKLIRTVRGAGYMFQAKVH